ncbi:MAG: hypothetical protein M0Z59_10125 [Nitrospiraceae bacterium]|nr:hypothetical protein [Nitrospiraceae bacterium]
MKKLLALFSGLLFVFGLAATAFAIHAEIPAETQATVAKGTTQITIGGSVRVRGTATDNTSDFNDNHSDHKSFLETSVHLVLDAQVDSGTKAVVELRESKGDLSGGRPGDDDLTWGNHAGFADAGGLYTKGGEPMGDSSQTLTFIQAWIQHSGTGLLGIPAGIKVGHMPLALGNGLFFSHTKNGDDGLVLFADPMVNLHTALVGIRFNQGTYDAATKSVVNPNEKSTAYAGILAYAGTGYNASLDITYVDDQNFMNVIDNSPLTRVHLWNIGLRGDTTVSGVNIYADGEIQTGKVVAPAGGTDADFEGWAAMVGAKTTMANLNLGLEWAYGSGDSGSDPDKIKTFITALDNVQHYTFVYEYLAPSATGTTLSGLANTQYVKAEVGTQITPAASFKVDGYWLHANEVPTGSGASHDIGWEVDGLGKYQITKNLTYFVEGGYLVAGDFYKDMIGHKDNAWGVRHGLLLSF